jgi:LysR family transcriptional activator of nhaA
VSQSALSAQIKQLEHELGHALFEREKKKLVLTEVGKIVLGYAEGIFSMGSELVAALSSGEGQRIQQLRVGSVATLSRNFQERFIRPVMDLPDVQLVIESGSLDELLNRLSTHNLHLVLSNRPASSDASQPWRCRRIARQQVCLVGGPRPRNKPFRFPEDLESVPLLVPGYSTDIRTAFDVLCEDLRVTVKIFAQVDDMAMLRVLARSSSAVALVPAVVVEDELRTGTLQKYCVVPRVYENFYAITTERQFQPPVLKQLLAKRRRPEESLLDQ